MLGRRRIRAPLGTEQRLEEAEARYRNLVEHIPGVAYVADPGPEGRWHYVSPRIEPLLGYTPQEWQADPSLWWSRIHPEDREIAFADEHVEHPLDQLISAEYRIRAKDGHEVWLQDDGIMVARADGVRHFEGVLFDITARKRAEHELRSSRELLRAVLDGSTAIIFTKDRSFRYLLTNHRYEEFFGLEPGEMIGCTDETNLSPEIAGVLRAQDRQVLETGEPLEVEQELPARDGTHVFLTHKYPLRDEHGEVFAVCGVSTDITVQKAAQEELRRRADRQAAVTELGGYAIAGMPLPELFEEAAMTVERVLPADVAKVLELGPDTVNSDDGIRARIEGEHGAFGFVTAQRTAPGTFAEDETAFLEAVANVLGWAITRDRAQRLEAQLQQSQRLESVGQLAGGIAHDFNNLLAVILNYARFAIDALDGEAEVQADIGEIEKAARRAADLTRQLLVFSRRGPVRQEALDVNEVVIDTESMLRRTLGEHIAFETRLAPDLSDVMIGGSQVQNILVNLAVNSRDAMPGGGTLHVSTDLVTFERAASQGDLVVPPGRYVRLTVADTGSGMSPEVLKQAFDPFFTTKPTGQGTGLGLATVYGAVRQAGGYVDIHSEEGHGATVEIHLPVTTAARKPSPQPRSDRIDGGGATVVLVEDEDGVRTLTERILSEHGYEVVSAPDGEAAIRLCRERSRDVDLLLTDVVMPRMSGKELAERIRVMQPGVGVLYMSGYTNDVIARRGIVQDGVLLLEKPFNATELLEKTRAALAQRG